MTRLRHKLLSVRDLLVAAGPVGLIGIALIALAYWWLDPAPPGYGRPADVVRAIVAHPEIPFDQCILEFGRWCHISFTRNPRRQALVIDHDGARAFA